MKDRNSYWAPCLIQGCEGNSKASGGAKGLCPAHYKREARESLNKTPIHKPLRPALTRFMELFEPPEDDSVCWSWVTTFARLSDRGETSVEVWKLSWELFYGPIPEGHALARECEDRHCINPNHYSLVEGMTQRKANIKRGENHFKAKLSNEEVQALREDYASGAYSFTTLGAKYGIRSNYAWRIVREISRTRG